MATEWYYQAMGNPIGPLTSAELLGKVRSGEILPTTQVRKNDSQWVAASEVGGLFEEAVKPVFSKLCPYCGASVAEKPPCVCPSCERLLHRLYQKRQVTHVVLPDKNPDGSPAPSSPSHNDPTPPASGVIDMLRRVFNR